ncbi:MAG TPA: adenylate/guanylate cyclase domain-containing protein [Longimicrobiales bacterium]|nr:adenylate/guanylate cyclase domain-containing protein [Longimicrobiales bacterium]
MSATPAPPVPIDRLLDDVSVGIAIAEPAGWHVDWENARFSAWFPAVPGPDGTSLPARIAGFDAERLRERLARKRPYRIETEVATGPRRQPVQVEVRRIAGAGDGVLVEAHNISRQKEAEYMLDSYSKLMERQARALAQEKERAERLLLNIMPRSVAVELQDFGTTTPQAFESASVLMLDFVGFTDMSIARDPGALIAELNDVFTSFDQIVEHSRVERIKTIGDAYLAVAGLPERDPDHSYHVARAALRMRRFLQRRNHSATNHWIPRIGIASGPVIGSIVGVQKYVYDIFGPAVNLAARLEAMAEPLQILVSADFARRVRDEFVVRSIGRHEIKGFDTQEVFALEDEARKVRA